MSETYLNPAAALMIKLGGPERMAEAAGVHVTRVYRWRVPKSKGGTDGLIPAKKQQKILDWARKNNIDVSPSDFFEVESCVA